MFWEGHKIWPIFLSFLTLLNSNYKWAKFLWPSQDMWTLWYLLQRLNQKLEQLFDFVEQYEMELTIFCLFFLFVYYLVLIDHTVQKLQNLHMYGVILKKTYTTQNDAWTKKKYKACLSQSISATKKTQRNGDFIFLKLPNY